MSLALAVGIMASLAPAAGIVASAHSGSMQHHSGNIIKGNSVWQCLAVHAVVCGSALYVYVHTIICVAHNIIFIGMPLLYKERGGTEPHIPRISILAD
jgi:hypothetical protein